ncbi:MAG TPA: alpha/beta hydrolase-fold protein [Ktedonobacterales bacterium]
MRPRETSGSTDETLRLPMTRGPVGRTTRQPPGKPARLQPQQPPVSPTWHRLQQSRGTQQSRHIQQPRAAGGASDTRAVALPALWQRVRAAWVRVLIWAVCAITATVATDLISASAIARKVSAFLYTFNFDQERVLLMTTLLMLVAGSAAAGVVFRRRLSAVVGGLLYFILWYLSPFLARVQHPPLGPAGIKQVLIPGALTSMTLTLLGIALVCASVGAAIGAAYGELVVTPLVALAPTLWAWVRAPARDRAQPVLRALPRIVISLALGGLLVYALALSSAVPGTLLTYGIEGTLYRLAPGAQAGGTNSEAHGTVLQGSYSSPSLGGIARTYAIYLPPSYSVASAERYPVLYLLHGSPGTPKDWMTAGKAPVTEDALLALGKMRETIVVGANGNGPVYLSQWANSFDGRQRMEDAIAFDLVRYIDQHYRTLADAGDRAIGGNSEGGYGAVNIALHHPEIFGVAMTMSGYFVAEGATFGYGTGSSAYRAYNSPAQYIFTASGARAAHAVQFIICTGTKDGGYYLDSLDLYQRLLRVGAKATLVKNSGGHGWGLWALQLGESLPLLEPPLQAEGTHS